MTAVENGSDDKRVVDQFLMHVLRWRMRGKVGDSIKMGRIVEGWKKTRQGSHGHGETRAV